MCSDGDVQRLLASSLSRFYITWRYTIESVITKRIEYIRFRSRYTTFPVARFASTWKYIDLFLEWSTIGWSADRNAPSESSLRQIPVGHCIARNQCSPRALSANSRSRIACTAPRVGTGTVGGSSFMSQASMQTQQETHFWTQTIHVQFVIRRAKASFRWQITAGVQRFVYHCLDRALANAP